MLEQNGFRRYTARGETQLLSYNGPRQNKKICYLCGSHDILSKEHTDPRHKNYHVFKVARYIIVSGQKTPELRIPLHEALSKFTDPKNKTGSEVKIFLGTGVISEGLILNI